MYNSNNYGYTPYGRYIPQQPMQPIQPIENNIQPVNNVYKLNGKQVDSIDVVKATDIPLDGSISYFPLANGSAIVSKQLQMDGTSKMVIFKPVDEQKEESRYITREDMEKAINNIEINDLEDIKEELKDLKKELKDLKKKKVSD